MTVRVVSGCVLDRGKSSAYVGLNPVVLGVGGTVADDRPGVWVEVDQPEPGKPTELVRMVFFAARGGDPLPDGPRRYLGTCRADVIANPWHVFLLDTEEAPGGPIPVVADAHLEPGQVTLVAESFVDDVIAGDVDPWRPSAAAVRPRWGRPARQALNADGRAV